MDNEIVRLVDDYESGQITRRQLVAKLGRLMAVVGGMGRIFGANPAVAQHDKMVSTFEAIELNHIALRVTDVHRSRDFYTKHLGLKVARESENNCFLTCSNNFVALFRSHEPQMDHYCYAIKNYDVDVVEEKLKAEGLNPRVHREGGRIYFEDPDGLTVQLASKTHRP